MAPNDKCSYSIAEKAQHAYMTKRRLSEEAEEEEEQVVSWFRPVTMHEAWTSKHRQSLMSPDRLWRFVLDAFWFLAFGQCVLIAWLLKCVNVGHVATVAELVKYRELHHLLHTEYGYHIYP